MRAADVDLGRRARGSDPLRVDGRTSTQNGRPLLWNPRGYYELALDAGSLTLSP